eukprot:905100_1
MEPPSRSSSVRHHKIVVLGGGGVGKSALTIRLVTDNWQEEYDPTIEDSYRKNVLIDDSMALLDILDTAGQEEFAAMQDDWIRQGDGFLLVYAITAMATFDEVKILHDKLLREKDKERVPVVLVGNKCDLVADRQVTFDQGKNLALSYDCPFFESSAKDCINNEVCFFEIIREIRSQNGACNKQKIVKKKKTGKVYHFLVVDV